LAGVGCTAFQAFLLHALSVALSVSGNEAFSTVITEVDLGIAAVGASVVRARVALTIVVGQDAVWE
jgi:hypothetical protein